MLNWDNTGVTVELGELIDSGVKLWDFDYPVPRSVIEYNGKTCKVDFDKATFEQKVIDHYRFRQIGQETPGRFLHYFRTRIREIMPYYVQVYEFDAKFRNIDDPLESYNLTETFMQSTKGTGRMTGTNSATNSSEESGSNSNSQSSETSGTSESLNKFSDTPQNSVDNLDNYLTNATRITGDETGSSSSSSSGTSESSSSGSSSGTSESNTEDTGSTEHTLTRKGNIGVQPLGGEVLNIRSAFINIDMQIIDELRDLFLQVY